MKFNCDKYKNEYNTFMRDMRAQGGIPDSTGGMTGWPGLFLYTVVRTLKPLNGLEVGTRNGMSAAIVAAAMEANDKGHLTSLDIVDVLNGEARPAAPLPAFKFEHNPLQIQNNAGIFDRTTFVQQRSTSFMADLLYETSDTTYDYILLDGSHEEQEVYEEIELACSLITYQGIIVLDDVYPDSKPRGNHKRTIKGPWLALERRVKEGFIPGYEIPNPRTTVAYIMGDSLRC